MREKRKIHNSFIKEPSFFTSAKEIVKMEEGRGGDSRYLILLC